MEINNGSDIVRWTIYVLFIAEEMGINSKNIDTFKNNIDPNIQRFMGEKNGKDHPPSWEINWD